MRDLSQGKLRQQITFLRRQFLQEGDLPFRDVLSEELVQEAVTTVRVVWNDAIYTPLVTLWVFLSQVLNALSRITDSRMWSHLGGQII